jgi:hypothetical protein
VKRIDALVIEIPNVADLSSPHFRHVYTQVELLTKHSFNGCMSSPEEFKAHPWGTGGVVVDFCTRRLRLWSVGTMKTVVDGRALSSQEPLVLEADFTTDQFVVDDVVFTMRVEGHEVEEK